MEQQYIIFFSLDIECNSKLENGAAQVAIVRRADVLVIDEFSMLDFSCFVLWKASVVDLLGAIHVIMHREVDTNCFWAILPNCLLSVA